MTIKATVASLLRRTANHLDPLKPRIFLDGETVRYIDQMARAAHRDHIHLDKPDG